MKRFTLLFAGMIAASGAAAGVPAKRFLLFSCVRDKNYEEELEMIASSGLFTDIVAVPMQGARALGAEELKECITRHSVKEKGQIRVHEAGSVRDAAKRYILKRDSDAQVFAAGSLYFIGEIKGLLQIKENR